ncbi:hypothetical protein KIK84_03970 [Curvibacter sp. CHRR-16]|uniref:ArnT family glycosyltransferase n=1 Tax=Curvibacter sp. CHRR-16 TaxID=2835872 RepID=UPI001BDAB7C5|nr:hypothetical protein [Curvibacter sp. CHRR-16]MBT0569469.1 hypothetical protein [Curvibacter sp. CHRR-16]
MSTMPHASSLQGSDWRRLAWAQWPWLALVLLCASLYLYGLGSSYAPTNGDEMVYLHIAHRTADSGHWLPLQSDLVGTRNTKPPLLIWQAMVAGGWGQWWELAWLRLPSVLYTFATTLLLALSTWRMVRVPMHSTPSSTGAADTAAPALRTACLAAATYLLCFSTYRYGRAYLTSGPETFWLGLPVWWLLLGGQRPSHLGNSTLFYTACGLAMGLGSAYKSFALLAPAAATVWLALLLTQPQALRWADVLRASVGMAWATAVGLGIFCLWFVLDPDPAAVWQEFVVAENAGKMNNAMGYWQNAWNGPYPLWEQLLGYPVNAGLLFLPVLGLCCRGVWQLAHLRQRWTAIPQAVRVLLAWAVLWMVVFSIPSQRSERYLIPAMPALCMLWALAWNQLGRVWYVLTLPVFAFALVMLARIGWVMHGMGMSSSTELATVLIAASAGLASSAAVFYAWRWAREASLLTVACVYACFTAMVAPLSDPAAQYSAAVQQQLAGQRVAVPNGFTGQYERFHFLLPESTLLPYDAEGRNTGERFPQLPDAQRIPRLLDPAQGGGQALVWLQSEDVPNAERLLALCQAAPSAAAQGKPCQLLGQRWHVRSRHKAGEITLDNLWQPQEWLFAREWLVSTPPAP